MCPWTERREPSFVPLRIENAGWREIDEDGCLSPSHDHTGIRVRFRERRVFSMAVTELSEEELRDFFPTQDAHDNITETAGFGIGDEEGAGLIRLPKAKLNPGAHCKVLAVLERRSGTDQPCRCSSRQTAAEEQWAIMTRPDARMPGSGCLRERGK